MPRQNHTLRALAGPKTTPADPAATETRLPTVKLANKSALLASEDPKEYEKLDSAFRDHVEPLDIIEEMLAGDVISNQWEVDRLKRLRADFIKSSMRRGVFEILMSMGNSDAERLATAWASGCADSRKKVEKLLAAAHLTLSAVEAQTFAANISTIERFDRLIAAAAGRRNGAIGDIDRRRHERERLRPQPQPIDASYTELDEKR
jgi:hypothetical protein